MFEKNLFRGILVTILLASIFGLVKHFVFDIETKSIEGIVVNHDIFGGNYGFGVYDAKTGAFMQNVAYSFCQENPKNCAEKGQSDYWMVKGYRPVKDGEHVRLDIIRFYNRTCVNCSPMFEKTEVTKLPDIGHVPPHELQFMFNTVINNVP